MKIAIVTDTTAYIPDALVEKYNIFTIPLIVNMDSGTYKEDELESSQFFEEMNEMEKLPSTSQPSIGDYILLLEKLRGEGYTDVIAVHLSANISGTCQNAVSAGQSVDDINLHVVDSEIACMVQGFLALYAAQHKDTKPLDQLLDELELMKKKEMTNAYFIVDTLQNLQKGGRLTNSQALIGNLLKVKPVLEFENGSIVPFEKIRTKKKAMRRVEERFAEEVKRHEGKYITAVIIHANKEAAALEWKEELQRQHPNVKFITSYFGPVIATHIGEGALGFGYTTYDVKF